MFGKCEIRMTKRGSPRITRIDAKRNRRQKPTAGITDAGYNSIRVIRDIRGSPSFISCSLAWPPSCHVGALAEMEASGEGGCPFVVKLS